ncbi:hypothetical protein [Jeotgalibaca dankookensis]|nr:hypothetical protein [Jeotgalibaca dankookensis]
MKNPVLDLQVVTYGNPVKEHPGLGGGSSSSSSSSSIENSSFSIFC